MFIINHSRAGGLCNARQALEAANRSTNTTALQATECSQKENIVHSLHSGYFIIPCRQFCIRENEENGGGEKKKKEKKNPGRTFVEGVRGFC